jgi:hypothetical protein
MRYRTTALTGTVSTTGSDTNWFTSFTAGNYVENADGTVTTTYPNLDGWIDVVLTLDSGVYTATSLATLIQTKIDTVTGTGNFFVGNNTSKNTISISTGGLYTKFYILTDSDLATRVSGTWNLQYFTNTAGQVVHNPHYNSTYNYELNNTMSCNDVLNNNDGFSPVYTIPSISPGGSYISNFLNLSLVRNLYISSPNLGSYSTLGARGESNILKKVPVTSSYGSMIIDTATSNHDFLDCSDQCLSTIEFNIRDVMGNIIPLHGSNVSFSIVFAAHSEDGPK